MSKHLLYRKDLLNRTLTRSLLFVLTQLVACLIVLIQAVSPAEAAGPLSVKPTNPRYFFDPKGKSVYLTGSYLNEYNTLSGSLDFASYLDFLQQQKQNFTRVWGWEQSPWIYDNTGQISFSSQPYERTGPGLALDGGLKFDLTRFNQAYFDQLRSRVVEAAQRGIYVSVMLFEGFSTQKKIGRVNPWLGDPFQQVNNINGVNGDPNRNGGNEEFFSLAFPSLVSLQEAFARKVVDTLNDLDNVLYEVNGNGLAGSLSWQYHMIDYIKHYQKKPANQHPVGISDFYAGATADVFNSSAEWIVIPETNLNPPTGNTKKVLIMEGTPPVSGGQAISTSPISLVQLLPDNVVSTQSSGTWNDSPSSNGVTLLSSSATSSTLTTTKSASKQSQVAPPTITPNGGVYSGTVPVTLQTTTPGASIYYTTDGQSPTQSSRLYTGKFTLSQSTLVKATAFKKNFDPSSEASAWFAKADAVSASSLVAYLKFDEGSGTTTADSSGNGNIGTLVNGPLWTAGRVGNALFFDGIDDNVTILDSASLNLSSSFTLSAWVNPASTFTDFRSILAKNYKYYLYASSNGFCGNGGTMGGFFEGQDIAACQSTSLPANIWTHLSVTYNGSTLTLYRDGVAVATSTASGTLSPTTGTLQIGASQYGEYFKGLIDEVRLYNKALSATEIQTIYQQDSATPVQTVASPIISPNGGSFSSSVPVTMQTATSGASIYYTTGGSTPTQSSTLYTGALNLTTNATVKAKAFKTGSNASAEASASFTVSQPFGFSLSNSGDISVIAGSSVTNSISAALGSGSAQIVTFSASGLPTGATASFSSTSCSPSCSSTLTINASNSTPAGSSTITVTASGGGITKTTTFSLSVNLQTVATPAITPNGGNFTNSLSVTMQTATSGASIYYTTNGSSPTLSSTLYTGAITLTSSAVVKAKAFKSGYNASAEASASFTVSPSGLVAQWKFDEGSGTTVSDSSGNGNTGTLVNGPLWTVGRVGNALFFDGIDDNVTVLDSNSLDLSSSFTLSAWVNPTATFTDFRSILAKNYKYYLYASSTGFCGDGSPLGGFFEGQDITVCQPSPLPASTWTHLTVTYNGSILTLYRNGVAVATSSVSGTLSPTTGTLQIGGSQYGEFFKGLIDEVRIYNRALSDTEIQALYQKDSVAASQTVATLVSQPFSFFLSNSGDKSVVAGSSVTNSIAATLVSGSSQEVSFNVSGLPSGATGSFSSASCSPACSTVLNISTAGSTPAGNFPITVTSTGGGVTKTTAFTLSVTLALTVATPTITPNGGNFSGSVSVAMQSATSGAAIYYTTDGSTPSQSSQLYTGAMTVTSDTTINTKAFKSGYNPSSVASASFTMAATAQPTTGKAYYVATNGSDSNPGTISQPFGTIKRGIASLASGDTLNIRGGTYNESILGSQLFGKSGTSYANPTTIQAYGREVVILNGSIGMAVGGPGTALRYVIFKGDPVAKNFVIDAQKNNGGGVFIGGNNGGTVDHIKFDGVDIKNFPNGVQGGALFVMGGGCNPSGPDACIPPAVDTGSNIWVTNSRVHDMIGCAGDAGGGNNDAHGFYITTGGNLIENTEIFNTAGYGIHQYAVTGAGGGNTYRNNYIHDTGLNHSTVGPFTQCSVKTAFAILTSADQGNNVISGNLIVHNQGGIDSQANNNVIYNNTLYNNSQYGGVACCYPAIKNNIGSAIIKNNIIFGNSINSIDTTGSTGASIVDKGTGSVVSNNLTIDPKFVDPAANNFHLQSGSPAIDAGTSNIATGTSIPFNGSAPDIGAFEY